MAVKEITFTFEYDIPDKYLYQTNELGLTTTFTYTGPAKLWIVCNSETNRVMPENGWIADDGDPNTQEQQELQAGAGAYAVLVDAKTDPVLASAFSMNIDQADYPQVEFTREQQDASDTTVYYSRAANPTPDHTYEIGEITYDPINKVFNKPYPWKKPHMTWDELWSGKDAIIASAQSSITDLTRDNADGEFDDVIADLNDYIDELNGLEEKFPSTHWDPWMVPFPDDPRVDTTENSVVPEEDR
jgi:hypothetical protein